MSNNTKTQNPAIDTATLLIKCKDQAGIVQAVSEFIHRYGANIITLDQYSTAHEGGQYFMRLEFALAGLSEIIENFEASFSHTVAKRYEMDWRLHNNAIKTKVGILVSKFDHALLDLLWRHQRGLLDCDITCVVSATIMIYVKQSKTLVFLFIMFLSLKTLRQKQRKKSIKLWPVMIC